MKGIYCGILREIDIDWNVFEQRDSPLQRFMARTGSWIPKLELGHTELISILNFETACTWQKWLPRPAISLVSVHAVDSYFVFFFFKTVGQKTLSPSWSTVLPEIQKKSRPTNTLKYVFYVQKLFVLSSRHTLLLLEKVNAARKFWRVWLKMERKLTTRTAYSWCCEEFKVRFEVCLDSYEQIRQCVTD
jgi:hypothetical protein